jgi:hypothetical protein
VQVAGESLTWKQGKAPPEYVSNQTNGAPSTYKEDCEHRKGFMLGTIARKIQSTHSR